jgi:hypothetical protein
MAASTRASELQRSIRRVQPLSAERYRAPTHAHIRIDGFLIRNFSSSSSLTALDLFFFSRSYIVVCRASPAIEQEKEDDSMDSLNREYIVMERIEKSLPSL